MGYPFYITINRFFANASAGINMAVNGSETEVSFDLTAPEDEIYEVWNIKFTFITEWARLSPVRDVLVDYSKFMDGTALTNGFTVTDTQDGEVSFSTSIKKNSDLITLPVSKWNIPFRDRSTVVVEINFDFNPSTPLVIDDTRGDFNRITIRDDMTNLISFTGSARGVVIKT